MKKILIPLIIIIAIVVVFVITKGNKVQAPETHTQTTGTGTYTASPTLTPPPSTPQMPPSPPSVTTVSIANFAFGPGTITVAAGSTVKWQQNDSAPHSIVSDSGLFQSATLSKGQSYSYTFAKAGVYTYHCGIHSSMKGTVIVQ